ncbi:MULTISPECIES: hypothetical protein [unclassified Mesorhizobium]|uniref:hypothetical protein n=1 Tax=unclassified Mesorhizobium TaxID=325217 RepID=UPI000FDB606E|nr:MULTISPECIES: hypothetical protein [unclassified Mesorhizobium]TGT71924.1 hypothetical protein EN809_017330 [Mesorhizobium sp. M2E.F.Ca.ET.166.01.1.1]TGV99361.1 hypothetical protein EN797_023925 [Mesorhizobium sp. M2E.F.Ca.ET.154.01.1.1]
MRTEISEKQTRSIKYQFAVTKSPLAKDVENFDFADTLVNKPMPRGMIVGSAVAVVDKGTVVDKNNRLCIDYRRVGLLKSKNCPHGASCR